jgi:hypothetical protein
MRDAALWTARDDYAACQQLAAAAREAGIEIVRYRSVRDPEAGQCGAVLVPAALAARPDEEQSWRLSVTRERVQWRRDSVLNDEAFEFSL